jgi:hypothetical protein
MPAVVPVRWPGERPGWLSLAGVAGQVEADAGRGPGRRDRAARGRMRPPGERPGRRAGWPAAYDFRQARGVRAASRHGQTHSGRRAGRPGCRAPDRSPGAAPSGPAAADPYAAQRAHSGVPRGDDGSVGRRGHRPGQPGGAVVLPPEGLHPGQGHRRPVRGLALPAFRAVPARRGRCAPLPRRWRPARHPGPGRRARGRGDLDQPRGLLQRCGLLARGRRAPGVPARRQQRSIGIASLISWRGRWYVVHFGAVLRAGPGGVVDSPATGPGVPGPAGGC